MAEEGRTVRASGLPSDIEDDRLKDKLHIHFLSARNGGGEIDFITVVKATPVSALITFEEREVAQRVVQRRRHILEVDGKKHKLTVTEHRASLDPDKVILSLLATVSYSQLPGGILALQSLYRSHPDVQISAYEAKEYCTLQGTYSKVQAALDQLLSHPGGPESADKDMPDPKSVQTAKKSHSWRSENHSRNHPVTSEEDFSLIVDADMFQYLQRHCWREYQRILAQCGVEVVDMTSQGLTTLFLQVSTETREGGHERERLELAREAISMLYQENEAKIRRDQLPKSILSPRGGLQKAIEILNVRLPKLLLNEDANNIYIIGSSSDVSEAKQSLLLDHDKVNAKKEDVASLLRHTDATSLSPANEAKATPVFPTEGFQDAGLDQLLRQEEDEKTAEGTRKCKLAACFKDSGPAVLSSRPTDFTIRRHSSPSRQTRHGPMLGYDVLSETAGISGERVSRAESQNNGRDVSFLQNKTPLTSNSMDTRPKNSTAPISSTHSGFPGSAVLPPAQSQSTLKRANSFSGTTQQKVQGMSQKSLDDSSNSTARVRDRSLSFSTQTGRSEVVYSKEITVSTVMWQHIKEAYSARVNNLTSDVQIKEGRLEGSSDLAITMTGTNQSRVSSCQLGLQELVESVSADFSVQKLLLAELGVTDPADETLQACCAEVRSRFKKVSIQIMKKTLYLLGPKELCSQVGATLQEVFSRDLVQTNQQQDLFRPSSSNWTASTSLQMNEEQSDHVKLDSQTGEAERGGGGQERRTNTESEFGETSFPNGPLSQPSGRKDAVVKEKVKLLGAMEMDAQRTESLVNSSLAGNERNMRRVNGVGSAAAHTDKAMAPNKKDTPGVSESGQRDPGYICVCGDSGTSVLRTKCGATMCPKCLDTVHVHCSVCHEAGPTAHGIQGKMKYSKLHISLPGHNKDSAIKITYCIPDGVQGKAHPSPGTPFKGGTFEAFLPDCEKTRKLLPRLEKAFRQGLTFTVMEKETGARVTWDPCIPHKTSLYGGKSGNGYPDSTYLTRLSQVLTSHGIEEQPAKSQKQ